MIKKNINCQFCLAVPSAISVLMAGILTSSELKGIGLPDISTIISQTIIQSLGLISVAVFSSIIGLTVKTFKIK